jgi:hypothetical protein
MGFVSDVAAPAGSPLAPYASQRGSKGVFFAEAQRPMTHDARAAAGYRLYA